MGEEQNADIGEAADAELERLAQGCTELSCPAHGEVNRERSRRHRMTRCINPGYLDRGCDGHSHSLDCNNVWYDRKEARRG